MYNRKVKFSGLMIAVLLFGLALSSNPPNGRTGAPGETTCFSSGCHSNPSSSIDGFLDISGVPSDILPNTTYTLTVTSEFTSGSPTRTGFQMVVLDSAEDDYGSLSNPSSNTTITPSGGRTYFEHSPAQNFNGNTSVSWEVDWTSPSGPDMEIATFYASSILANGNGNNGGDRMKLTNVSGTLDAPIIPMNLELIEQEDVTCFQLDDGFALIEVSGGTPPYTYLWNNGETTNPAIALPNGDSEVTVTDDIGTTETLTFFTDQPEELEIISEFFDVSCNDANDGSIVTDGFGGTSPYTYTWSTGDNSSNINGLGPGDYELTVTDDNQCEEFQFFTISEPVQIEITANITNADCLMDGTIEIITTGGVGTLTASWSNGVVGNIITGLDAGLYSVTVSDANNCSSIAEYEVFGPTVLDYSSLSLNIECNGSNDGSIELIFDSPSDYSTIDWSTGDIGTMISNLPAGNYGVTIVDNFSCSYENTFVITEPDEIVITNVNILDASCGGLGQIEIVTIGGTGTLSAEWSNGATGNLISNLQAGDYTVEVFDENNCALNATFSVGQSGNITYQSNVNQPNCAGDNNASIELIFDSFAEVESIQWSTGETTSSISGLMPGTYTVLITDIDFCEYNETFVITAPQELVLIATPSNEIICFGDVVNTLVFSTSGGTPPFSFFQGTTMINVSPTNLPMGTYEYNVVDSNGCVDTIQFITASPTQMQVSITTGNTTDATSMDGTAVINMTGGTPPYMTGGSTFMAGQLFTGFAPGFYQYTVTDANNCVLDISFTISDGTIPCDDLILNLTVNQPMCLGDEPEFITTITGGTAPYTTVFQPQAFYSGDYTVSFVDANNCSVSEVVTINYTDIEPPTLSLIDVTVALDINGQLEPYTFIDQITDNCPGMVDVETITMLPDLSGPSTTAILVRATDELGNTSMQEYLLTIIDTIPPSIFCLDDITVSSCVDYPLTDPFITDNSGTPILTSIQSDTLSLGNNIFIYSAEDSFGNFTNCTVNIFVDVNVNFSVDVLFPDCPGESSGFIDATIDSTSIITFENGMSSLPAGTYTFTVTDTNTYCSVTESVTLFDPEPIFISNEIIFQLSESGASDGALEVAAEGGTLPYSFNWIDEDGNTISTDPAANNLPEGTYTCIITDANGCLIESNPYSISFESSIADSYLQQVEIYPNPFTKEIYIESPWVLDNINIYNAQGKLVFVVPNPNSTINLDHLVSGLYLVEIIENGEKAVKRIIKQ